MYEKISGHWSKAKKKYLKKSGLGIFISTAAYHIKKRFINSHAVGMAVAWPYGFEIDFVRDPISESAL